MMPTDLAICDFVTSCNEPVYYSRLTDKYYILKEVQP